jgi:VanZ family protein
MRKQKWLFICVFVLSLVLFFAPFPSGASGRWGLDKLTHLLIFTVLLFFGLQAFLNHRFLIALWLILYAPIIELLQYYIFTYRSFDVLDIIADYAGLVLGWVGYQLINHHD